MPSPFDLHGAGFLVFYLLFGLSVLGVLVYRQLRMEGTGRELSPLRDPYLIAYLRGGEKEAVHLAVVTLMRRDLLKAEEGWLTAPALDDALTCTPLEKAILSYFSGGPGRVAGACGDPSVRTILNGFEDTLVEQGLLPTPSQNQSRGLALLAAGSALWLVAALPMLKGAPGGGYGLAIAALVFTGVAAWWSFRRRTAAGDRLLADLRQLLRGGSATVARKTLGADAALLAAVYGVPIMAGVDTGGTSTDTRKQNSSCGGAGGCSSGSGAGGCSSGTGPASDDGNSDGGTGGADGGGSDGGSCGSGCGGGCGGGGD